MRVEDIGYTLRFERLNPPIVARRRDPTLYRMRDRERPRSCEFDSWKHLGIRLEFLCDGERDPRRIRSGLSDEQSNGR